ncbi:MAG TPA: chromate efflux transporter [Steroidobacteraceae bacterium]|nr:chromate efflux transporter [Steroidobacteraceae bacterium]
MLRVTLQLGLTSFGGPLAHIGYFERAYVRQRHWLSAEQYAALVGLCQMLPGPTSSQVGFLVGLQRAGWPGAIAAWLGFTLPSAVLLYACARLSAHVEGPLTSGAVHGLKLVAVAVVAQAVWNMAQRLCTDLPTWLLAIAAAVALLVSGGGVGAQPAVLAVASLAGAAFCRPVKPGATSQAQPVGRRSAWAALTVFALVFVALGVMSRTSPHGYPALALVFYRSGALVFGGGHVVLPLLRDALVPPGWLTDDSFLTGYGLAQAMPGPLFTVAAYLGALAARPAALGALIALACIFLPGLLLAVAGRSLWDWLARQQRLRSAITGINAAVVGVLAAALYNPVWTSAVHDGADVAVAAASLAALQAWRAPPLLVVFLCVGYGVARGLL